MKRGKDVKNLHIKYRELMTDDSIDTIYKEMKRCIDHGLRYDHYLQVFDQLNNEKIPKIIQDLLE